MSYLRNICIPQLVLQSSAQIMNTVVFYLHYGVNMNWTASFQSNARSSSGCVSTFVLAHNTMFERQCHWFSLYSKLISEISFPEWPSMKLSKKGKNEAAFLLFAHFGAQKKFSATLRSLKGQFLFRSSGGGVANVLMYATDSDLSQIILVRNPTAAPF